LRLPCLRLLSPACLCLLIKQSRPRAHRFGGAAGRRFFFELKLRPQRLREFIGQKKVKDNLEVASRRRIARRGAGPRAALRATGMGKTTLANIIANEMGAAFQQTSDRRCRSKATSRPSSPTCATSRCCSSTKCTLQPALEELLYSALEDYKLDIIIGQDVGAHPHHRGAAVHLIGATTRAGCLAPLRRASASCCGWSSILTRTEIILQRSRDSWGRDRRARCNRDCHALPGTRASPTACCGGARLRQVRGTGNIDKPRRKRRWKC